MVIASGFVNSNPKLSPTLTAVITSSNKHSDIIKVGGFISPLYCCHVLILQPQSMLQPGPLGEQGKDKLHVVQQ